ncbi:hypothetical protein N0V82_006786 [Gnomoniopsis sp. IMI 355080]|nr:hypothetical protein N0V82_006786 [Gnomoniopsis sp. IMI 355080]
MLASRVPSAVAHAMRACGRTLPADKSMPAFGPSSTTSRVLARRTFLITPSYKARVAVRGYATASATATKKAPATRSNKTRIAPANPQRKRPAAKKATTKAKAKPKAKKAKAKPKKAVKKKSGPAKKPLSPEKKAILEKRELKKVALLNGEPKRETISLWTTYVAERVKNESIAGPGKDFGEVMKRLSVDFKSISSSDKSRLEQKALENKATNAANYKKWVESHTVEDIYKANLARSRLTRVYTVKTRKIIDERMPKRPTTSFAHFVKARMSSHNEGQSMLEAVKEIGAVWKSLSAADKKPYEDLTLAEKSRYVKEMQGAGLPTPQFA